MAAEQVIATARELKASFGVKFSKFAGAVIRSKRGELIPLGESVYCGSVMEATWRRSAPRWRIRPSLHRSWGVRF